MESVYLLDGNWQNWLSPQASLDFRSLESSRLMGAAHFSPSTVPHSAPTILSSFDVQFKGSVGLSALVFRHISRNKLGAESEADLLTLPLGLLLFLHETQTDTSEQQTPGSRRRSSLGPLSDDHRHFRGL